MDLNEITTAMDEMFRSLPEQDKAAQFGRFMDAKVQIAKAMSEAAIARASPDVVKSMADMEASKADREASKAETAKANAIVAAKRSDEMKVLAAYKQEAEKHLKLSEFGRVLVGKA